MEDGSAESRSERLQALAVQFLLMAKGRGKKFKDKGQNLNRPVANKKMKKKKKVSKVKATNAVPFASIPLSDHPQALASAPATNGSRAASRGKEKAMDKLEQLSGFIFMCNVKTKPECFRYRVFGLPAGKREVVEKIKTGMKLFLFDFDLKLLYGVYSATCCGQLNLESSAFGGKFPAQVRFVIYKDCLPLPESAFRRAIKDNYQGSKFKQELSDRQVRELLLLFRPCVASTAAPVAPMPQVALSRAILPSALDDRFHPLVRLPPPEDPHLAGMQHGRAAPMMEPHPVQHRVLTSRQEFYGTEATMDRVYPALEHQSLPALNDPYYFAENRRSDIAEDTAQIVQDQYPRYRAVQEMAPRDRLIFSERHYTQFPLQRVGEFDLHQDNVAGYYNSYPTPHGQPLTNPHDLTSGRPGLAARNTPISYYSFAGATQLYR